MVTLMILTTTKVINDDDLLATAFKCSHRLPPVSFSGPKTFCKVHMIQQLLQIKLNINCSFSFRKRIGEKIIY